MKIIKEKINGSQVLKIEGRLDTSNFAEFEKEISQLFESGEKNLVFECSGLNYISSSGLRVFLTAQKKTISLGGKLHLCCLQPVIREIFDISGFSTIFRIFDTLEQALES